MRLPPYRPYSRRSESGDYQHIDKPRGFYAIKKGTLYEIMPYSSGARDDITHTHWLQRSGFLLSQWWDLQIFSDLTESKNESPSHFTPQKLVSQKTLKWLEAWKTRIHQMCPPPWIPIFYTTFGTINTNYVLLSPFPATPFNKSNFLILLDIHHGPFQGFVPPQSPPGPWQSHHDAAPSRSKSGGSKVQGGTIWRWSGQILR